MSKICKRKKCSPFDVKKLFVFIDAPFWVNLEGKRIVGAKIHKKELFVGNNIYLPTPIHPKFKMVPV